MNFPIIIVILLAFYIRESKAKWEKCIKETTALRKKAEALDKYKDKAIVAQMCPEMKAHIICIETEYQEAGKKHFCTKYIKNSRNLKMDLPSEYCDGLCKEYEGGATTTPKPELQSQEGNQGPVVRPSAPLTALTAVTTVLTTVRRALLA